MYTGALEAPFTVTMTGCNPVGALAGIVKLICDTPIDHEGSPTKVVVAATPPTVTAAFAAETEIVPAAGTAPVVTVGVVNNPSPVANRKIVCPRPVV